MQLFWSPVLYVARVSDDDALSQRSAELHRVLQRRQRLLRLRRVVAGEDGEVGRVNRRRDPAFRSEIPELLATLLLPGEALYKRELNSAMTSLDEAVQEGGIIPFWWKSRDTKPDHGHMIAGADN